MQERRKPIKASAINNVLTKAKKGTLRTMRFKGMMSAKHKMRHALIDEFAKLGPVKQINQAAELRTYGKNKYQGRVKKLILNFKPDLVMFQAQGPGGVTPLTVRKLRREDSNTVFLNFDGDCHFPLTPFHFEIAKAVHLQLVLSPTLYRFYAAQGISVKYWPIGLELDYIVDRAKVIDGPDVLFLGALYEEKAFPEALTRRNAVKALYESDLKFKLYGAGWPKIGIMTKTSNEQHGWNAKLMARTKMTLSISQASHFWGYTSDRLYNICATGCPALVQRFAGMKHHGYVDGETCIAWKTVPEMLEKARYYLRHKEERERIGARGKEMTLSRHTWAHRVKGLFTMLEGLR